MSQSVNLISPAFVTRRSVQRAIRGWLTAGTTALVLLIAVAMLQHRLGRLADAQLTSVQKRHQQYRQTSSDVRRIRRQFEQLVKTERGTLELSEQIRLLDVLGVVSLAASSCDGAVQVADFDYHAAKIGAPPNQSSTPAAGGQLALTGLAANNLSVAKFAAALREAGVFASVELTSTGPANSAVNGTRTLVTAVVQSGPRRGTQASQLDDQHSATRAVRSFQLSCSFHPSVPRQPPTATPNAAPDAAQKAGRLPATNARGQR